MLTLLPTLDDTARAEALHRQLDIARPVAAALGREAVEISAGGRYFVGDREVRLPELGDPILVPPDEVLAPPMASDAPTRVQVTNETTLAAAHRLVERDLAPLALNFANGVTPGGGFLSGARAQEEYLSRSSTLHASLVRAPAFYEAHRRRTDLASSDHAILCTATVFRGEDHRLLDAPWDVAVVTCAAPVCRGPRGVPAPEGRALMHRRIARVLEVAAHHGYRSLVLGAWGCGAFRNDPHATAESFRHHLEGRFAGCFEEVVFAVTDWSPERRFLGPFRDVFEGTAC